MQKRGNVFLSLMILHNYVSHAQKIAVGYNRTATGDNMGHKQNSTIDISWIF